MGTMIPASSMNQLVSLRLVAPAMREAEIGPVASRVTAVDDHGTITVTPTITAVPYSLGDAVGGLLTFTNATRGPGLNGEVQTLIVVDRGEQNAALDLILFDRSFTATADNTPFNPSDADLANVIGMIPVLPEHYVRFASNSMAMVRPSGLYFTSAVNNNVYGQLIARGMPTYAIGDLTLKLTVKRN